MSFEEEIVEADGLNGHAAVGGKMPSRIMDGWVKAPDAGRIRNSGIDHRAIGHVIQLNMTAQILQISRQWFECVDVTTGLNSCARNQRIKADVSADVIYDVAELEMTGEESLVFQLPVSQPKSPRAGIGDPSFASSWTTYDADDCALRDEFEG